MSEISKTQLRILMAQKLPIEKLLREIRRGIVSSCVVQESGCSGVVHKRVEISYLICVPKRQQTRKGKG